MRLRGPASTDPSPLTFLTTTPTRSFRPSVEAELKAGVGGNAASIARGVDTRGQFEP